METLIYLVRRMGIELKLNGRVLRAFGDTGNYIVTDASGLKIYYGGDIEEALNYLSGRKK